MLSPSELSQRQQHSLAAHLLRIQAGRALLRAQAGVAQAGSGEKNTSGAARQPPKASHAAAPSARAATVAWEEYDRWYMDSTNMFTAKCEGAGGTRGVPWEVVEEGSASKALRTVGLEYMRSEDSGRFIGRVAALPLGYQGALRRGELVLFAQNHISNNPQLEVCVSTTEELSKAHLVVGNPRFWEGKGCGTRRLAEAAPLPHAAQEKSNKNHGV
jgi:hypothetical protein